jgi:hypothetical protein
MKDQQPFENKSGLARWLAEILQVPQQQQDAAPLASSEIGPALAPVGDYHPQFYQQLPGFIMALLHGDPEADIHYAPLLYHLAGCESCHHSYLELYDALRFALQTPAKRPLAPAASGTLSSIPQRMLGHLSQLFISQAEAIQLQARHDRADWGQTIAQARSLLQLALRLSAHITQSSIRRQATQDLVRVATIADGPSPPPDPNLLSYSSVLSTAGGTRRGKRSTAKRTADAHFPRQASEPPVIQLQARELSGRIIQRDGQLELQLQDLEPSLRGHAVTISVLLGSLLEPVRWRGGNPRAIHSTVPVDEHGNLVTILGETELRLTEPSDFNLLETIFMLLEIRAA